MVISRHLVLRMINLMLISLDKFNIEVADNALFILKFDKSILLGQIYVVDVIFLPTNKVFTASLRN